MPDEQKPKPKGLLQGLKDYFGPAGAGTPESPYAPWQETAQKLLEYPVEAIRGALGSREETWPNRLGEIGSAAFPVFGKAVRGLIGGLPRLAPEALDMSDAARLARAAEQGYTMPVYHGTTYPKEIEEFPKAVAPLLGYEQFATAAPRQIQTDFGIHVTPSPLTAEMISGNQEAGGRIMPLLLKPGNVFEMPDVGTWRVPYKWPMRMSPSQTSDPEVAKELLNVAEKYMKEQRSSPLFPAGESVPEKFQKEIRDTLQRSGYDTIKYKNEMEGVGEPSYMALDPNQLRSPQAAFDPAKIGSADLLAGGAPLGGLLAAGSQEQEPQAPLPSEPLRGLQEVGQLMPELKGMVRHQEEDRPISEGMAEFLTGKEKYPGGLPYSF